MLNRDSYYYLEQNYTYIIYGAGIGGKKLYRRLNHMGYEVSAFIDQRAEQIKQLYQKNVLLPDDYKGKPEDTIIIISVANYFEHKKIAQILSSYGFNKIIYMPPPNTPDYSDYAIKMTELYNKIMEQAISNMDYAPFYQAEELSYFTNSAVISRLSGGKIVVSVPLDICYTQIISGYQKTKNIELCHSSDLPFYIGKYKLIEYFKVFEGTSSNPDTAIQNYHNFVLSNGAMYQTYTKNDTGLHLLDQNRFGIYQAMNQALNDGLTFFEKTPIKLAWNTKGYFNLIDGHHRLAFFCIKGFSRIPAEISSEDYKEWINEEKLSPCISAARQGNFPVSCTPIEHPNFYYYPTAQDMGGTTRLQKICSYLVQNCIDIKNKKILDLGCHFSNLSRFFHRMGAEVTAIESEENFHLFAQHLNQLLYCNTINLYCEKIESFNSSISFDIVIMLGGLGFIPGTETSEVILKQIDKLTGSILIWESGKKAAYEKQLILKSTSFSKYERLGFTVNNGSLSELGVFYKT